MMISDSYHGDGDNGTSNIINDSGDNDTSNIIDGNIIDSNDLGNDTSNIFFNRLELVLRTHGLSPFSSKIALAYLQKHLKKEGGAKCLARVMQYLLDKLNNKVIVHSNDILDWQKGCPNRIPNLTSSSIWNKDIFPWVDALEKSYNDIKSEFLALRNDNRNAFQPYRSPISSSEKQHDNLGEMATDKGSWNVCYLYLHGMDFQENLMKCPITTEIMKTIPRLYDHSFFSALAPNSHITSHYGPTNKKLRCHLPLLIPHGDVSWLRVGDNRIVLKEGECIIFDDSFEHEAGNDSLSEPRVILVIDVWHPDLTNEEIYLFKFINNAQLNAAKKIAKMQGFNEEENKNQDFFSIISNARRDGIVPSSQIWGYQVNDD